MSLETMLNNRNVQTFSDQNDLNISLINKKPYVCNNINYSVITITNLIKSLKLVKCHDVTIRVKKNPLIEICVENSDCIKIQYDTIESGYLDLSHCNAVTIFKETPKKSMHMYITINVHQCIGVFGNKDNLSGQYEESVWEL